MKRVRIVRVLLTSLVMAAIGTVNAAESDSYPSKPMRLVVTYPPGGAPDLLARVVGQAMSEAWKQQVLIDNRPGGGGIIGTDLVAKATPDGYTFLLGTSAGLVIQPLLLGKAPYDPLTAFAPVSLLTVDPQLLVVTGTLPVQTVKELIAFAKAKPGALNYASSGTGAPNYINMEAFKLSTGARIVHVPYQGTGPAMVDLLTGRVQLMWSSIAAALPQVKAGKLRALAIGDVQRGKNVPDVPTMKEAGVANFEANRPWYGLVVPAKTPNPVIGKLNAQLVQIIGDPAVVKLLASHGFEAHGSTPEELGSFIRAEYSRLKKLIAAIGLKQ